MPVRPDPIAAEQPASEAVQLLLTEVSPVKSRPVPSRLPYHDRQGGDSGAPSQLAAGHHGRDLCGEGQLHAALADGGDPAGIAMTFGIGQLGGVIQAEPG